MLFVMLLVSWEVFGGKKPHVYYIHLNKVFLNVTFATLKRPSKIKMDFPPFTSIYTFKKIESCVCYDFLGTKKKKN